MLSLRSLTVISHDLVANAASPRLLISATASVAALAMLKVNLLQRSVSASTYTENIKNKIHTHIYVYISLTCFKFLKQRTKIILLCSLVAIVPQTVGGVDEGLAPCVVNESSKHWPAKLLPLLS